MEELGVKMDMLLRDNIAMKEDLLTIKRMLESQTPSEARSSDSQFSDEKWYSKNDISTILGLSNPTITRMMKPYKTIYVGRKHMWTGKDVKAAVMAR